MDLHISVDGTLGVVRVDGNVTSGGAEVELEGRVRGLIDSGVRTIVLDLAESEYVDSSGLAVLISSHKAIEAVGGELRLRAVGERLSNLLAVTRLDEVLHFEEEPS
jgi:anti-anti-sigma factor